MIRISVKNISIVCILSSIFFFIVSCGGGTGTIEAVFVPNAEFHQFVSDGQKMTPAEFCQWWNTEENRNYRFYLYKQLDPNSPIVWPENPTSEQVFNEKIINCFRVNILIQKIFPGSVKVLVNQPTVAYDHYYLKLSDGSIINNTNDGKTITLKYIPIK